MSKWGTTSSNATANGTFPGNGTAAFITVPIGHASVQIFCAVFVPIVCALGFVGNVLAFILLKESAMRVSSHFYLCCLAVADSVTLVSIMMSIWYGVIMQGYYYIIGQFTTDNWVRYGTGICWFSQLRIYVSFMCRMVSIWLVVVLTVERCIAVLSPLKWGSRLCTVRNAIRTVAVLCVVSALINIYVIFGFERKQQGNQHRCSTNIHFHIGRVFGSAFLSVIPWAIICVANALLVVVMRRRNRRHAPLVSSGADGCSHSRQERQERSITVRLLVISIAFLVFTLPTTVTGVVNTVHEMTGSKEHKSGLIADMWLLSFALFACNFACNFLLYCFTGQNFRRAAWALLLCRMKQMDRLRAHLDRSGSQSAGTGSGASGTGAAVVRSDSGNSRTNVTFISRESSDISARHQSESVAAKQRLLRKETRI